MGTLEERLNKGIISKQEYNTLKKQENAEDDAVSDVMYAEPDMFLAKAIVELRKLPLQSRRAKARELSTEALLYQTQAEITNNRYDLKAWGNVQWKLRTLK
tara:strand:- start:158 stop:460 length:303 start_codon:yes stop_codon:yes gene_type:complete